MDYMYRSAQGLQAFVLHQAERIMPRETRQRMLDRTRTFANDRPMLFAFLVCQLVLSFTPVLLFVSFALSAAGLALGAAVLFTLFWVQVGLLFLVPVLCITVTVAACIWLWGASLYWTVCVVRNRLVVLEQQQQQQQQQQPTSDDSTVGGTNTASPPSTVANSTTAPPPRPAYNNVNGVNGANGSGNEQDDDDDSSVVVFHGPSGYVELGYAAPQQPIARNTANPPVVKSEGAAAAAPPPPPPPPGGEESTRQP